MKQETIKQTQHCVPSQYPQTPTLPEGDSTLCTVTLPPNPNITRGRLNIVYRHSTPKPQHYQRETQHCVPSQYPQTPTLPEGDSTLCTITLPPNPKITRGRLNIVYRHSTPNPNITRGRLNIVYRHSTPNPNITRGRLNIVYHHSTPNPNITRGRGDLSKSSPTPNL